ncbi:MAG: SDR family oxidoreductase [Pelobium sp.]
MKVFVTGATGFIGNVVVKELLDAGHQVLGLARSEKSAEKLIAAGATIHHGDLENLESLRSGARAADAVMHLGFIHDFTRFEEVCAIDKKAIETIGETLIGTDKPFIITSGTALISKTEIVTEKDSAENSQTPRKLTEEAADELAKKGVKVAVIRLSPSVHGEQDVSGFVPILINIAKEKGKSAMINEGSNVWPAVHRLDAAKLYRLVLEKSFISGTRFHAVAEQGVEFKKIATLIAEKLNIPLVSIKPDEADEHFTWFSHFAQFNNLASSEETKKSTRWNPQHSTLLEDIENDVYTRKA